MARRFHLTLLCLSLLLFLLALPAGAGAQDFPALDEAGFPPPGRTGVHI
ncbi:MAG: hypothetical protein AB9880_08560 [Christensenellales bacterium]